jgi:hypothetical protein
LLKRARAASGRQRAVRPSLPTCASEQRFPEHGERLHGIDRMEDAPEHADSGGLSTADVAPR